MRLKEQITLLMMMVHLKDLSDDSVIEKLNAFVGSINDREYLVAEKQLMN